MKTATQVLLTFLLNASWQVALIAGCAGCGGVLLRAAAARYQHALWVAALLLAVGLPVLSGATQLRTAFVPQPPSIPSRGHVAIRTSLDVSETGAVADATTPDPLAPASPAHSALHLNSKLALALAGLYLLFLLYRTINLFRAWLRTRAIIRSSFAVAFSEPAQLIIRECQTAFGVRKVRILCSALVDVPITAGILNPLIILPEQLQRETDADVLTSAMGHELVHIARRDYILNLIYELIYLPLSFHPAAAFVRRRIKSSRELCCDERVTESLINPAVYARSLVRLIAAAPMAGRLTASTTIGITESDNLEVRIMSLLRKPSLTARRRRLLLIAASLLMITPGVAAAKFALSFDIGKQEPNLTATQEKEEKLTRRRQQKEELKRAERELKEQAQKAPASERAEIQARLLEVQQKLEAHEKALSESYQENQLKLEGSLVELQSVQERRSRSESEAKTAELREKLAQLESAQPADVEQMREARQKLFELYQQQSGDRKARLVHRVEPQYTEDAREKKIEGSVVLSLTVDHDGLPQNIAVKKSLYPSLDQSAVEAARKMRFEPAMKNGQPVSMTVTTEFVFSVEPRSLQENEAVEKQKNEERALVGEAQVMELRTRKEQEGQRREGRAFRGEELTRGATISMDRAIQIATSKYPGKVLACSLGRDREGDGRVFYHVVIISGDGDKSAATYVWVSAVDGQILKSEKE